MSEAYKVGITIALTNKISSGLMMIRGDLAKTDAQALKLHATLRQIKTLGIAGALIGGAGYAGLHALGKTLEAAKEYQQAFAQFKAINLGDAVNAQADKFARGSSVIGASATELMTTLRDLTTVFGAKDIAMTSKLAPQVAQMAFANKAVFGGKGMDFGEDQLKAMEKIIEMRGGFQSPDAFLKQADMMQKVISSTGGMVKPSDYMQFIQTAGVAGRLLTDQNFYYTMEPLIQEMHAGRVGTGTMSAYNNLAQGKSTVRSAKEMMKFGLLDPSMVEYNKIGTIKQIRPGALKGMDEFTSDPYHWMKDILLPALAAKGITADKDVYNELGAIFGNRTGSNLFSLMFKQQEKIEKNVGISKNAMDTRQLYKLALSTPQGAEAALGAAWQNLKIAAGEALIPIIIPALNKLADALRTIGHWAYAHPRMFDALIYGFAGLSASLLFSGSVLTLKAAFLGFNLLMPSLAATITTSVIPALGALSAVLIPLAAIAYHKDIANAIDNAAPGIGDWLMNAKDKMSGAFHGIHDAAFGPPPSGKGTTINTQVNLDGRQIAQVVTKHQANTANSPLSTGSSFDGRLNPQWGF